jgi:hypothetical protein
LDCSTDNFRELLKFLGVQLKKEKNFLKATKQSGSSKDSDAAMEDLHISSKSKDEMQANAEDTPDSDPVTPTSSRFAHDVLAKDEELFPDDNFSSRETLQAFIKHMKA